MSEFKETGTEISGKRVCAVQSGFPSTGRDCRLVKRTESISFESWGNVAQAGRFIG